MRLCTVNVEQLASFIRGANYDETYSFAARFEPDELEDAQEWYGILKVNMFDRDVVIIGLLGSFNHIIIDLEYHEDELRTGLIRYLTEYVYGIDSEKSNDISVCLDTKAEPFMKSQNAHQYDPNRHIAIIWSIEDVQAIREDLSDEQAMKVLHEVKRKHDCDEGVHWDTLRYWADELYPNS